MIVYDTPRRFEHRIDNAPLLDESCDMLNSDRQPIDEFDSHIFGNESDAPSALATTSGAVGIITLNRPEKRNAINPALLREVRQLLARFDDDPQVLAIVITGSGEAFCEGMDFYALGEWRDETVVMWDVGHQYSTPWPRPSKPVVCAANGTTATSGLELALACDFIIASERATFADTHARAGFVPGWGLTVRLPLAVGVRRAREMSFTARYVAADEALRIGLVEHVVPHAELLTRAVEIAAGIAAYDPATLHAHMRMYDAVEAQLVGSAYHREATHMALFNTASRPAHGVADRAPQIIQRGRAGDRA